VHPCARRRKPAGAAFWESRIPTQQKQTFLAAALAFATTGYAQKQTVETRIGKITAESGYPSKESIDKLDERLRRTDRAQGDFEINRGKRSPAKAGSCCSASTAPRRSSSTRAGCCRTSRN
jgi:hypothetical protein